MAMASAPTKSRLDGSERSRSAEAQFIRRPLWSEGTHRYGYCYGDRAFINRSYQYVAGSGGWKREDMFIDLAGIWSDGDERGQKGRKERRGGFDGGSRKPWRGSRKPR